MADGTTVYTTDELMIVNAARRLGALAAAGRRVCFVGIGLPSTCELVMSAMHPGVTREQCVASTGWSLRFADEVVVTEPPTARELDAVRALQSA